MNYNELNPQIINKALRFPEVSENSIFFSMSDDSEQQKIVTILKDNGLKIKELKDYF